jgi:transcriptional regulator with XRE-family HTH domain
MTTHHHTPAPGRGPADRTRLASTLRAARLAAGLAGTEAGRRTGISQSKISKIERGFLLPSSDDVTALCRAYNLSNEERDNLVTLAIGLRDEASAKVIMARGVAETQRRIGNLELSASLIRGFQPTMVIGLLQTAAYMRCVFGTPDTHALSDGDVDDATHARTHRQRMLDNTTKQFVFVMTEGALRWQAGSATTMADQIQAIAQAAARPNVRIGIIPWTTPVRVFPRHGFHLYDDDAVMIGTETATATLTGPADIATYIELFHALEDIAAFDDTARDHLTRITADYDRLNNA